MGAESPFDRLTPRERQIVHLGLQGRSNKEVAFDLGVTESTVRVLVVRAAGKFGVRGRAALLDAAALLPALPSP